jgi:hypothetical protein
VIKLVLLAAVGAAAAASLLAPSAGASTSVRYGVQDNAYLSAGPRLEERAATLDRLGAKLVRYMVNWRQIAPRKPRHPANPGDRAYDWSSADAVLGALHAHRIGVLATLYRTPPWASARRRPRDVPASRSSLAAFALAVARRYPWLRLWEVWNEPNLSTFLLPVSPRLYVQRLLNPTLVALHAANPANRVAGGATSPRGTATGLSPVAFMRGMRAAHARLDVYSHHPYPVTPRERPFGFAHGVCRFCKGVLTLANLPVLVREVKRDFGRKRIWLTEYGNQTNPPDPYGVSWARQAQYVAEAALRVETSPLVDMLVQFMVEDEPQLGGWQSGLFTARGVVKPSFNSFRLPIAEAARRGRRTTIWGQVRPGSGRRQYVLQRRLAGRWLPVGRPTLTDGRGSYRRILHAPVGARYRILWLPSNTASRAITVR